MGFSLNSQQAKGLANFFFDVAKGLVLGGIGFATLVPLGLKLFSVLVMSILAIICVKVALILLEDIK
jgi:hypothetical protein